MDFSKEFQLKIFLDKNLEGELWANIQNFSLTANLLLAK